MTDAPLDRVVLDTALRSLARKLGHAGVRADVFVFGGAAMLLTFPERPATADVDAVFEPDTAVRRAADEVAAELGLPRSWLNNQASAYLPRDRGQASFVDFGSLRVAIADPTLLLALKLRAARRRDERDLVLLIEHLAVASAADALAIHERFFPDESLGERQRMLLADLFSTEEP
jgi:hypothetical protein